jgi:hypothetical protein
MMKGTSVPRIPKERRVKFAVPLRVQKYTIEADTFKHSSKRLLSHPDID